MSGILVVCTGNVCRSPMADMVDEADPVLCMASDHRGSVVRARPDVADKTFTMKELVRLLETAPSRGSLAVRVAAAAASRGGARRHDEDVRDPLGDPIDGYREVADDLLDLSRRLAVALTAEPA
jgi:protein-tyrosine-phosphatase